MLREARRRCVRALWPPFFGPAASARTHTQQQQQHQTHSPPSKDTHTHPHPFRPTAGRTKKSNSLPTHFFSAFFARAHTHAPIDAARARTQAAPFFAGAAHTHAHTSMCLFSPPPLLPAPPPPAFLRHVLILGRRRARTTRALFFSYFLAARVSSTCAHTHTQYTPRKKHIKNFLTCLYNTHPKRERGRGVASAAHALSLTLTCLFLPLTLLLFPPPPGVLLGSGCGGPRNPPCPP